MSELLKADISGKEPPRSQRRNVEFFIRIDGVESPFYMTGMSIPNLEVHAGWFEVELRGYVDEREAALAIVDAFSAGFR